MCACVHVGACECISDDGTRPAPDGACGTATVCVPIGSITQGETKHEFGKFDVLNMLRSQLMAIQLGEAEDKHGWMREVKC